jgi:hypothetical protein
MALTRTDAIFECRPLEADPESIIAKGDQAKSKKWESAGKTIPYSADHCG